MNSYPTYKQAVILMAIWLLWTLLTVLPFLVLHDVTNGRNLFIIYSISMSLTCATGFYFRKSWSMPMTPFAWQIIAVSIVMILSAEVLLEPLIRMADSKALMRLFNGMKQQPYSFFFMVVVAAPLLEEFLFRGIILDGFLKNYKPIHAICTSALLFAVIHGNIAQGLGAFFVGVVFGWIYYKTQSILPSILLHALVNATSFFSVQASDFADMEKSTRQWIGNDFIYFAIYVLSGVLAGLCAWLLHKKYFDDQPKQQMKNEIRA